MRRVWSVTAAAVALTTGCAGSDADADEWCRLVEAGTRFTLADVADAEPAAAVAAFDDLADTYRRASDVAPDPASDATERLAEFAGSLRDAVRATEGDVAAALDEVGVSVAFVAADEAARDVAAYAAEVCE